MIFAISPAYFPFPRQFFCNSLPELDLTLLDSFHKILYCKCTGVFYFACCTCRKSVQEEPTMTQFSKQEKSWILYDVANSAFTMLIPQFFQKVMDVCIPNKDMKGIAFYSFLTLLAAFYSAFSLRYKIKYTNQIGQQIIHDMRYDIFERSPTMMTAPTVKFRCVL